MKIYLPERRYFMLTETYFESQQGGKLTICSVCLREPDHTKKRALTVDHVLPKKSAKDHKNIVGPIIDNRENLLRICFRDHLRIDREKFRAYYKGGLYGLVLYSAAYPRSLNVDLQELQRLQWIELFQGLQDNLCSLNGGTPPFLKSEYDKTQGFIKGHINNWVGGNFRIIFSDREQLKYLIEKGGMPQMSLTYTTA